MGKEASIGLFVGFGCETTLFELGVKMHGAAVRPGPQHGVGPESGSRLENGHEGLWWFETARVEVNHRVRLGR